MQNNPPMRLYIGLHLSIPSFHSIAHLF